MRIKLVKLGITLLVMMALACQNTKKAQADFIYFSGLLQQVGGKVRNDQHYLVIPLDGCNRCVDSCVTFSKRHIDSHKITFIISSVMGQKAIDLLYDTNRQNSNLLKDSKGIWASDSLIQGQIFYIKVENKHVTIKEAVAPKAVSEFLTRLEHEL